MTEAGEITARTALVFLLATWPRRILVALLLLIPIVVAAAGGFRESEPPPRAVDPGGTTDTGAYLVAPQYYFVSDRVDAGSLESGERWLGAVVEITNQGTEPISVTFGDRTFEIPSSVPNEDSANPVDVLRLDTGGSLRQAQPDLTYEVALLWRTTGLQDPPSEMTFTMNRTVWTPSSLEAGLHYWTPSGQAYDVTLPRNDTPPSILEEDEE